MSCLFGKALSKVLTRSLSKNCLQNKKKNSLSKQVATQSKNFLYSKLKNKILVPYNNAR